MATQAGELEVKLTLNATDFKKAMTGTQNQINDFGKQAKAFVTGLAAVFSFAEIAGFFKKSLDAYAEQELAVAKLVRSLENQGIASDAAVSHLTALANELQLTTGYTDEAIISAQALMTSFGLQGDQADRATKAAVDLSAAMGIDLSQAAQLVGKAFVGETGALSRYGIVIDKNIDSSEKFGAVLGQIEGRFGGAATAQAATFSGQMKQLGIAFGELQETIGSMLAGPGAGLVTWITGIINGLNQSLQSIKSVSDGFSSFGEFLSTYFITLLGTVATTFLTVVQKLYELAGQLPIVGGMYKQMAANIATSNQWLQDQIVKLQTAKLVSVQTTTAAVAGEKQKQKEYQNTATTLIAVTNQSSLFVQDKMKEELKLRQETLAATKKAQEEFTNAFLTTNIEMWKAATSMSNAFFDGMGNSFSEMVMEGKDFGDSMKMVMRDMAKQIISYVVSMIAKLIAFLILREAARSLGGGYGRAAAAAMTAAASASTWGGDKMAEGGMIGEPSIITGLRTGRTALAGEAGPEAVVPMNKMGGGGMGGVTVNVYGQFIEGDAASWQRLIREYIVPEIRRFSMAVPTGPFNRRRGVA